MLLPLVPDDDFTNVLNVRPEAIALFEIGLTTPE